MSSRINFIKDLFALNKRALASAFAADSAARYLEIGRHCRLIDYLNNGERKGSTPFATGNGFIALTLEAGTLGAQDNPYIAFYGIAVDGQIDTEPLREQVWQIRKHSPQEYLTCPIFMNEFGLDKILLKIRIADGDIASIETVHLVVFDEETDGPIVEKGSSIADYLLQSRANSFLHGWCKPFFGRDQVMYCDVRAVDRDELFSAHSFYATLFNTEQEIKEWTYAYAEDMMNIITIVKSVFVESFNRRQRIEAVKSAATAIMSRNMSHNLGSHYLFYTKSYLETIASSLGEKGPAIRGAAKVLGYMQARMDYLATIVTNDKYPNGAVNFKSQIFDELTVDDFSRRNFSRYNDRCKRTTNFLLSHLVMSENITRPDILRREIALSPDEQAGGKYRTLRLQLKWWRDGRYETFTGDSREPACSRENDINNELARLNIALPGGTMSCHAFFNVVENFIRNSAKYMQEDFKEEGLVVTIAIRPSAKANAFDFVLYDNKANARRVLPIVSAQLGNLRILDHRGRVEKSSKGIKEMLFSSLWMRAATYPDETLADVIGRIQDTADPAEKTAIIDRHAFRFVAVAEDGTVHEDGPWPDDNLGLLLTLPEFSFTRLLPVAPGEGERDIVGKGLDVSADVVCFDMEKPAVPEEFCGLRFFTRCFFEADFDAARWEAFRQQAGVLSDDPALSRDVFKYKCILDERFRGESDGDIDNICLWFGDKRDMKRIPKDPRKIIYFERHLSTRQEGLAPYRDYASVDSVSGGNFTMTLKDLFEEGVTDQCRYRTWDDKLLGLKIKESALTRITLVDERLFNSMKDEGDRREEELSCRNIRVMSVDFNRYDGKALPLEALFEGNAFRDGSNRTHFLSLHLGLIEKVLKSEWGRSQWADNESIDEKVGRFMQELVRIFGDPQGRVFISVHSGRGNFSKELEGPLATYPFISLAAIENAFSNSKFLLSQLFYNTVYIGKGILNA